MIDLDFTKVSSFKEIQDRFISIARTIFSEFDIELRHRKGETLKITSLELYLYKPSVWEDPTVHSKKYGFEDQLSSGQWYFHRRSKGGALAPRRMGLDITAGTKGPEKIYAGLLVRGVNNIDGPALAVNSILFGAESFVKPRNWKYSAEQKRFLSDEVQGAGVYEGRVALVKARSPRKCSCYIGKRKGLARSASEARNQYIDSDLRLATHSGDGLRPCEWP